MECVRGFLLRMYSAMVLCKHNLFEPSTGGDHVMQNEALMINLRTRVLLGESPIVLIILQHSILCYQVIKGGLKLN